MRHPAIARLMVMGGLTLGLMVPITWVRSIVGERTSRRDDAVREVSTTWGGPQTFGGVVLSVPYVYTVTDGSGRREMRAFAHMVPSEMRVDATLRTERRRRGIFDVVVYRVELAVRGRFRHDALEWAHPTAERIDWSRAVFSVGLSDPRGVSRRAVLTWNGRELPFSGGVAQVGLFGAGIQTRLTDPTALRGDSETPFTFTLSATGTREIRFVPTAEETTVLVQSAWSHPSFVGSPLPEQSAVTRAGFTAQWRVPDVGRSFPGHWTSVDFKDQSLAERARASAFGVDVIQPVDIYQQTERAVKYAVLFFALTFMVFFLWEIFGSTRLHPVHYAFVGFALCVFYLLLVSISEHAGFDIAYSVASTAITLLIGAYSRAVLRGRWQASSVVGSLAGLYAFLYLLLRLEDYALLAGSVGLLVVLTFLMFVTRRMDWYELNLGKQGATRAS
jgi:inner membrane protein